MLVCFLQFRFPPNLSAGVKHADEYAQYPRPPCVARVFQMVPAVLLVQPPKLLAISTAVFCAETLAASGGGAARHGARLPLPTAVFIANRRSTLCVGVAPCNLAGSICAMIDTDTTCLHKSGAAFLLEHFPAATAVFEAPASGFDGTGAIVERAESFAAMFIAKTPCYRVGAAAFCRARHCLAAVFLALPSYTDGVGNALVRCAVSIGAVVQPSRRHSPNAPCLEHNPRACAFVEQPSIEHGFLLWVQQSPLA